MEENQSNGVIRIKGINLITILGIPQLITGVLCTVALVFLIIYGTYPQELSVLYFQMACAAAGSISILLGLESIVFMSKEKRGVRNALIFDIIVSVLLCIVLISTARNFADVFLGETIMGSELDLWDKSVLTFYGLSYSLGIVASVIFFCSLVILAFLLYKNLKQE